MTTTIEIDLIEILKIKDGSTVEDFTRINTIAEILEIHKQFKLLGSDLWKTDQYLDYVCYLSMEKLEKQLKILVEMGIDFNKKIPRSCWIIHNYWRLQLDQNADIIIANKGLDAEGNSGLQGLLTANLKLISNKTRNLGR